jgi:hypothetical protein
MHRARVDRARRHVARWLAILLAVVVVVVAVVVVLDAREVHGISKNSISADATLVVSVPTTAMAAMHEQVHQWAQE